MCAASLIDTSKLCGSIWPGFLSRLSPGRLFVTLFFRSSKTPPTGSDWFNWSSEYGGHGCHGSLEIWKQVIVNRFFDLEIFWRKETINSIFYICYTLLMRSRLKSFRHFFFLKSCSVNNSKIKIQYTFRSLDDGLWSDLKNCLEIF